MHIADKTSGIITCQRPARPWRPLWKNKRGASTPPRSWNGGWGRGRRAPRTPAAGLARCSPGWPPRCWVETPSPPPAEPGAGKSGEPTKQTWRPTGSPAETELSGIFGCIWATSLLPDGASPRIKSSPVVDSAALTPTKVRWHVGAF